MRLNAEESRFLTKVITLGAATELPVLMSMGELVRLIGVIFYDTGFGNALNESMPHLWRQINPCSDYYDKPTSWFLEPVELAPMDHIALLRFGSVTILDFSTYLRCLSELHKRRRKYEMILSAQPLPKMLQVSPRALVEYGSMDIQALASWLTWRKFFYDLDNRSAQETGYLFEPILAAAIGGEQQAARARVVTRTGDPSKGRQVDCWKVLPDGTRLAYEFKLRVTIAASQQGRFGEEVQFARDCMNSGAIPVLVILDPTPNIRMTALVEAFEEAGGHAFIGEAAWQHLEDEAGPTMSKFIEHYVKRPVFEVSQFEADVGQSELLTFIARLEGNEILLSLGNHQKRIQRREDPTLENDDDEESA